MQSALLTTEQKAYLNKRAERLNWSAMQFASQLFRQWFNDGCPSVSPLEDLLPKLPLPDAEADKVIAKMAKDAAGPARRRKSAAVK